MAQAERRLPRQPLSMVSQFIKFSLVGIMNTAIHYGVFYVLYSYAGFYHLLASGLGFCVAVSHPISSDTFKP